MRTYLSLEGLAEYLGISRSMAYQNWKQWVTKRGLRAYTVGTAPRFRMDEVDKWIEKQKIKITVKG